jgi:hypothetical protein
MIANMAPNRQHPADTHDLIRVQGARVNNLKDVAFEGTPAAVAASASTLTGEHLAAFVGGGRRS